MLKNKFQREKSLKNGKSYKNKMQISTFMWLDPAYALPLAT